jgi:hypothetical protein
MATTATLRVESRQSSNVRLCGLHLVQQRLDIPRRSHPKHPSRRATDDHLDGHGPLEAGATAIGLESFAHVGWVPAMAARAVAVCASAEGGGLASLPCIFNECNGGDNRPKI